MASPYYVAPLGGLDVGEKMTAILEGGKQKYKEQQWEEKAPGIIKSGNPDEIANLMLEHPDKVQVIAQSSGYKNARALQDRVDRAKKILSGEQDAVEAITEHIQRLDSAGEDTTRS